MSTLPFLAWAARWTGPAPRGVSAPTVRRRLVIALLGLVPGASIAQGLDPASSETLAAVLRVLQDPTVTP